jgi:hypothetical protein
MILALNIESVGATPITVEAVGRSDPGIVAQHGPLAIRPMDGWRVPDGMRFSQRQCARYGVPLREALMPLYRLAENSRIIIAHGLSDLEVKISQWFALAGAKDPTQWLRPSVQRVDTAALATPFTKLAADDDGNYRQPTLNEAREYFSIAEVGAAAVLRLYDELMARLKGMAA